MRAGRLAGPLLAVLLTGCAHGPSAQAPAPAATSTPASSGIAGVPECEQLPETTATPGGDILPRLTLACPARPGRGAGPADRPADGGQPVGDLVRPVP